MKNAKDLNDHIIPIDEFNELLERRASHCVSIYLPTSRAGRAVREGHAQLTLKNQVRELRGELARFGLSEADAGDYLEPVEDLLDDRSFWRNQSDCLALFLDRQQLRTYTLPVEWEPVTCVADHFYLLPVMSLFSGDGLFHILVLSLQEVKLYEASRHSITPIDIGDLAPGELEEAAGHDYRQKALQFRSGQDSHGAANFHGQGAGKDDRDAELVKFMRAVDRGIMKYLKDKEGPLLLACVDEHYPVYSSITAHPTLADEHVSGNQDKTDPLLLHEMAWPLVRNHFLRKEHEAADTIRRLTATGRTSADLGEIMNAAFDGRIDTLMVQKGKDRFGLYDSVNRTLIIDETRNPYHASLFNLAATLTWQAGGQVFIVEKGEIPLSGSGINALFRY